jgi:hypothetical protein
MTIKHGLLNGTLKEIKPNIFALSIPDHYDRAMFFCRYQEFYESPFKEIRGKYFSFEKLMRIYKNHWKKDTFTYPIDWTGYNIPSNVLNKAIRTFGLPANEYDQIMRTVATHCEKKANGNGWYLIGAESFESKTMNHEIAHGLYYTNKEYKKECTKLINDIKPTHYEKLRKKLVKMGYMDIKKIIDDEIQAFMSTGLYNGLDTKELKKYEAGFINNFNNFK